LRFLLKYKTAGFLKYKRRYLPFVLMHFVDLVLLIQGGEEGVLNDVVEVHAPLSLCHPPCCFFGICLRHLTFTKYSTLSNYNFIAE
jgi:hypothetical protein